MLGVSGGAASPAAPTDTKTATAIILTPEPECPDWQFAVDATTTWSGAQGSGDARSSSGAQWCEGAMKLELIKVCNFSVIIVHASIA